MTGDTEKQVNQNTIDIGVLKQTSGDTLRGVIKISDTMDEDRKENRKLLDEDRKENRKSFDNIDKLLRGKDSENPGLVMRVDRLENFSKRIKGILGSLITAMIAMAATVLSWVLGLFGKGS